ESLAINVFKDLSLKTPLIIFFASLLPLTISRVLIYSLNGIKKIWQSNLLDQVLSITIVALILLAGLIFQFDLSVDKVAQYYLFARALVLIITVIYWKKQFQFSISFNYKPELKNMLTMAFPLLLVSSTSIIASNADTIMIGWLMDTKNVGLYSVAAKIALLTSFILQVTNSAVSPRLAYMFDENKIEETQRMVKQVSFFLAVIAIGFMVTAFFLGEFALSLWGMEFVTAYYPLLILCAGQFFNISTGCAGLLLVMCGHEKILGKISVISLLMNLGLNIILIKHYGIIGAAIATAGVITVENIMKVIIAKRKTGILSIPFSW
ncbi:MAG: polysaccharide biosynthesis C-terminal domain-containing protein, partial [Allomuricauda sp.]